MAVPLEMLVHPELLSNEQLISVIQERHLRVANLNTMTRDDLLELFHSYCVPYGQRKYRDKGRGKLLNKTRQISHEPASKMNTNGSDTMSFTIRNNRSNGTMHSNNCERSKPPPDTLAGHMKRIKIATIAVPIYDNNLKRKITFGSDILATDSPPQKKERKQITWP